MRVSKSAYYHWLSRDKRLDIETPTMKLRERIREIFHDSREIYGSCRIQKMLEREGLYYCRSYVGVLMREMGLRSILRRKYIVTTDSDHAFDIHKNILDRNFESTTIGKRWISDITYIRVKDDWNYLTTVIDLADRKVVGWSLSEDMTTENTIIRAWLSARSNRDIKDGFIFHSDRGVQYASNKKTNIFAFNSKVTQSMSRKGNCWDNAVAESFFKTIKYECLYRYKFKSYHQLYSCLKEYIAWYNTIRLHSSLGYLSPLEKELELLKLIKNVA